MSFFNHPSSEYKKKITMKCLLKSFIPSKIETSISSWIAVRIETQWVYILSGDIYNSEVIFKF